MTISRAIGRNIVQIRKKKGITQERLALDSNMSVSYLRSIEHGTANPTIDALNRLAITLGTPFNSVVRVGKGGGE